MRRQKPDIARLLAALRQIYVIQHRSELMRDSETWAEGAIEALDEIGRVVRKALEPGE